MAHIQDRRKQGRGWVARYIAPDGSEKTKAFRLKSDAEKFLTNQESRKLRGEWIDPALGKTTFAEYVVDWKGTAVDLRASSRDRKLGIVDNYLLPQFGTTPLAQITTTELAAFIAALGTRKKKIAPATIRKVGIVLKGVLDDAARAGYIARSPAERLRLPAEARREMVFLDPAEVAELADAIAPHYAPLVSMAAYSGLRWGELAGLRVGRLDLMHRQVSVVEQLTEVRGEIAYGPPKTSAGQRTVTLPRFLVSMLEAQIGTSAVVSSGLVFPSPKAEPMRRSPFRRHVWASAVKATGHDALRFHDLRHTAVAFAIAQGAHPKAIQERMGHSSITTTMDRYGHLFPSLDERIADGLDALFAQRSSDSDGTETGRARDKAETVAVPAGL